MGFLQKALLQRMGVGSRLANTFVLARVVIAIARRMGLISDDRVEQLGLQRAGITQKLSVAEMAMAGWIVWRFFYRRSSKTGRKP